VGLDVSPGAVEVSSRRGVDQTFLGTVEDLAATNPAPFDSFVGLGNNLGLLADPARAITFLEVLGRMSHAGSNLVGTILDPYGTEDPLHLAYHEANRGAGRLAVTDPDTDLAGDARPRPGSDCSGAHRTSWPKWSARPDGSWLRSKVRASMPPSCGAMGEPAMTEAAEEGTDLDLDFSKLDRVAGLGVLPCAVQDVATGEVILIAYVNAEALQAARSRRRAVFWSTSRNELWEKGATSGAAFELVEVRVNCEQNSLLYLVRPLQGGICHTRNQAGGARNCFYRCLDMATGQLRNMDP
jgi:phosphoribosyl-AMP cyclohydrolase